MSSILLSNPFPAPPPASTPTPDAPAVVAVAPVTSGSASSGTQDGAAFSGSGSGSSNQASTIALFQSNDAGKWAPPTKATGGSIVNAQAQDGEDPFPFGSTLPEVEMPDPLPTSPFLKGADDDA